MEDISRRRVLQGAGTVGATVLGAGCSSDREDGTPTGNGTDTPSDTPSDTPQDETPTDEETQTEDDEETDTEEDEQNVNRPGNYRWDLKPGRNDALRSELGQYVSGNVGGVVQGHPAFEFSTDRENDDHTVDFEALKLYRDSNFDIMANDPNYDAPMEQIVQSFVDDSLYQDAKSEGTFIQNDTEAPTSYSVDQWLDADSVEESLDLGHNLLTTIFYDDGNFTTKERAASIREAYKRHHDFDVLAWEVPMEKGSRTAGMMYSPDDDKVRTFNSGGPWSGGGQSQIHTEIQDWRVVNNPENFNSTNNPENLQHPVLFHTDEWDRQGISFEDAKEVAVGMVFDIATEEYIDYNREASSLNDAIIDNITMTTGATEQLTRTLLDYNKSGVDADFEEIWEMASFAVGKYIDDPELNGVIDTVEPGDDSYDEYFGGGFAFYEVEDEEIVDEVRNDQSHEYDNFGEVYDELETA